MGFNRAVLAWPRQCCGPSRRATPHEDAIRTPDSSAPRSATPHVLILSAEAGGGHRSLAQALRDLLAPRAAATIIEPLPRSFALAYRAMSRWARWLWGASYRLTDTPRRARALHAIFGRLFAPAIADELRQQPYRLIIATHPFLLHAAARAAARQPLPCAALFADPERVHATWLAERGAAATLAPTRETYAQAQAAGFPAARLHLSGWPVRRQFWPGAPPPRAATLGGLGFDPARFTAFVQGGGEGSAGFAACVAALLAAGAPQILLAYGTNQSLAARFQGEPRVRAIPFTSHIAPFMAAADLVIGKAGPNALFEAVTLGAPFVATTYIPGQEHGNAAFIERHGLGWAALDARAQHGLLRQLVAEPARLDAMRASVARYRAWNTAAAQRIAAALLAAV